MKVLILGSGAREHALGWKLKQQGECKQIWVHPGNSGTVREGFENFGSAPLLSDLISKAKASQIDLVIVGPETFLEQGFANGFREAGILVVGPNQASAKLESSKIFAKDFLNQMGIPTASSHVFSSYEEIIGFSNDQWPWVLKLDGLAAGKGVVIAHSTQEVFSFAEAVWKKNIFGSGPHRVLAETFIQGREISYIGFCDGESFVPLASATDYKRIFNGDRGPNTGGMGAVSPSPFFSPALEEKIRRRVIQPFLKGLNHFQLDFRGILFVGLMIDSKGNPLVLEFNTRFGDPETQCLLPRLETSFLSLLLATAQARLSELPEPIWSAHHSVYIVVCSEGYPEDPKTGSVISGLDSVPKESFVFYGGVKKTDLGMVSNGGRVLGVGNLGPTATEAREKAYQSLSQLQWAGMHFRTDIGA